MIILGIETSCDETTASVLEHKNGNFSVLSNCVSSQVELHSKWGGVVPNLAAREHLKNIIPIISESLKKAGVTKEKIDLIAVTKGPGLIPALLIGTSTAKTLSYLWKKPLVGIHHIEGHIYANFISPHPALRATLSRKRERGLGGEGKIKFPILCLVVSGGHTQLVLMKKHLDYEIIGETLDDAAGEAFDKVARILGLGYPGGPAIALQAMELKVKSEKFQPKADSPLAKKIKLPRPMINSKDFNFSFSGLKTAVLYETKKHPDKLKDEKYITELCHEFQQATIDVLIAKTIKAAKKFNPKTIMLAGGVSANLELRKQLDLAIKKDFRHTSYIMPDILYSLDNAAMIAAAAFFRWEENKSDKKFQKILGDNWEKLQTEANLKLS